LIFYKYVLNWSVCYVSNSNWSIATNKRESVGYIEYTVSSSTEKLVDFNGKATAKFVLNGNFINISGTNIGRYKSIGSTLGECTLEKHYDTLTIVNTYTFSDVLEFDCGDYKEFYGKNKGTVANYTKSTFINGQSRTVRYGISVVNN